MCSNSVLAGVRLNPIVADAAIFQGVQPSAVDAVTSHLRPAEFPARHVFIP